jgi:hypothetical protein
MTSKTGQRENFVAGHHQSRNEQIWQTEHTSAKLHYKHLKMIIVHAFEITE